MAMTNPKIRTIRISKTPIDIKDSPSESVLAAKLPSSVVGVLVEVGYCEGDDVGSSEDVGAMVGEDDGTNVAVGAALGDNVG